MSGIALSIILDKPDKTYEGGETISGQVKVIATEDVRTAALVVVLYCKGYSEKKSRMAGPDIATMEKEIKETNLFKGPWTPGEFLYHFSFAAPPGPLTYKGHVFDVTWHIGAKVALPEGRIRMSRPKRTSHSFLAGEARLKIRGEMIPKK